MFIQRLFNALFTFAMPNSASVEVESNGPATSHRLMYLNIVFITYCNHEIGDADILVQNSIYLQANFLCFD